MTATTQIQQATKEARRRATFWRRLAGACALGAAGVTVAGLFNLSDALLSRQFLAAALLLVFLAMSFRWAGWSAGRYASTVGAGAFVREEQKVRAAHQGLRLFLALIALAALTVVGLAWSWVAAGFGASVLLVAWLNILAGGVPVGDGSWSEDRFDDDDRRPGLDDVFTSGDGLRLGGDDLLTSGDGLRSTD